jgi:hypothetical protein
MKKSESISFGETLSEPAYEHLRDVALFLDKARDEELFQEKYLATQEGIIVRKVKSLHLESPQMPLNKVVATILSNVPENTSPDMLLELTRMTIDVWESQASKASAVQS